MRKTGLAIALVLALGGGYLMYRQREAPKAAARPSKPLPKGPAPALPIGFPPVFPGAKLDDVTSKTDSNGWQHTFVYTSPAKATELVAFYRKELPKSNLEMVAEGAGPYGAMLRAADAAMKRTVMVEIDAPEDKPKDPAKIRVTVVDIP